ncbi:aldehyde dehydrogenase family protein [Fictibacillus enclensis]|uniref:aldehyde dehydrogenase family protein n=1 Tax=Fictibacillus enclensis TaxID=1017270 RepID=UPI0025A1C519|nr:aldehyde dehydrogenase family protein [Fictibacillus enclensis]MDM5340218.1 aldehyde dehydrogenase family protein [Fictibacillus enclensis]
MVLTAKRMYVNGEWTESRSNETFNVLNPANSEKLYSVPRGKAEDIHEAVKAARTAFESEQWQTFKPHERGRILFEVAQAIRNEKEKMAELETLDTGKPIGQARSDVEAAARYFEYYAGVADKILGETIPVEPGILDYTVREPVGVTAHVIPWNYPIQISSRSTAAAIATGNAVVLKPAEDTPATALKLAEIFEKTALPKGIFNVVTGYGYEAGAALSNHPDVNHITFTGSVETGITVMTMAAKNVTPVTLELGGKSPNIVFADCNEEEAVKWVVRSIIQNAGQTCSAGARLLVESSIHEKFVAKVVDKMESLVIGPGMTDPDIGPILSEKQFNRVNEFVQLAKEEGARVLTGGEKEHIAGAKEGYYFQPTVIDHVDPDSKIAQEEIFGPVLTVFPFTTEEEALNLANGTEYGLVTGIWTRDIGRAHRLAGKIRAGQIFINNYGAGGGIQMPFGGYKKSGFGREKGLEALKNYTQVKNVAVNINV